MEVSHVRVLLMEVLGRRHMYNTLPGPHGGRVLSVCLCPTVSSRHSAILISWIRLSPDHISIFTLCGAAVTSTSGCSGTFTPIKMSHQTIGAPHFEPTHRPTVSVSRPEPPCGAVRGSPEMRRANLGDGGSGHYVASGYSVYEEENEQLQEGLRAKVSALKSLTIDIGTEVKYQNKMLEDMVSVGTRRAFVSSVNDKFKNGVPGKHPHYT
ncbi:hypothetical protein WMY93_019642 [Mugilogobius chulae]|uniref:t-SNARE coiled-coil homology domain-containing protein n=1 Tax=Mugilogobius chulae TaxID=88201 RepID=A0AAW0NS05_9GOBI